MVTELQRQVVQKCKKSILYFLEHFGMTKHPAAGIIPLKPFKYQVNALRAFRKNRFTIFKKCRQCFSGESMVWGPNGHKRIDSIRPGDTVYTYNQITGSLEVVPVIERFDNGERECAEVSTRTGHRSVATLDHRYFTWSGPKAVSELTGSDALLEFDARSFDRIKGEIRDIIPVGLRRVYDLRVPPYDNYLVDGAAVHNSGISKISGAFALWFAMFYSNKTILVVSRTDSDAMLFLAENVKFLFDHLPKWMQELWDPVKDNEHELFFPNGSKIRSLTSHPDVLRSNASSLNIIDEAAFIQDMATMWAAGFSTLQHGGVCVVVSTCNGVGNWYWSTWTDSESGLNDFNPITINWWDMDWKITYRDALSNEDRVIAPTDGIRKCTTPEEIETYGPYWSPWLEEQYRGLQEKGEGWKFQQEVLADFVGSGNTVIDKSVINYIGTTLDDKFKLVKGPQSFVHPTVGKSITVDFNGGNFKVLGRDEGLWVWKQPEHGKKPVIRGKKVVEPGITAHRYVAGVDLATGKGKDYFALEMFDIDEQEQAAEIMIHTKPKTFLYIVDYIGRWYNNALLVVERNNGGDAWIDELREDLVYPNIWRKITINDRPSKTGRTSPVRVAEYGFFTSGSGKPKINRALIEYLRAGEGGFKIYSRRLHKQILTYVRKKDRAGRDTDKTEAEHGNFDDLVIAAGLAFIGAPDAALINDGLVPYYQQTSLTFDEPPKPDNSVLITGLEQGLVVPIIGDVILPHDQTIQAEVMRFASQLGALPMSKSVPTTSSRKYIVSKRN